MQKQKQKNGMCNFYYFRPWYFLCCLVTNSPTLKNLKINKKTINY